jgi:uncharacterized protein YutE (UPF0331/DUF86 family)
MSPGEIDVEVVRRHLVALRASVSVLSSLSGISLEELDSDTETRWTVERGLQLCAQNALDIATHIAAGLGRDIPDYVSAIDELARLGVLDQDFVRGFRSVAGFRNVLVHGYLEVDLYVLTTLLHERLDDFEVFATGVEAYLESL